ncbi:hypothetical protein [Rubrivirga sp.]|uniref:hypothetical protein n=1 Tax=Rubrivirga sp. TaxID=1885344 RepID=UPI003B51F527
MPLPTYRLAPLGVLLLVTLPACDAVWGSDLTVRGQVVDAATGKPVDPGPALVAVQGAQLFGPTATVLSGGATPEGWFDLSGDAGSYGELLVQVGSAGRVEYPGTAPPDLRAVHSQLSYFPVDLPYRSDVGVVELLPTCLTVGAIRLARPLARSEQLRVRVAPVPEAPPDVTLHANGYTYEGSTAGGDAPPDSLWLLAVGGRPALLEWEINEYNPPDGDGQGVFARGAVPLPTCPRHGVLRYSATLALPE